MKKIVNFDKMFDKAMQSFIDKNIGKYDEKTLENKVATLYEKFGNNVFDELGGVCPNEYYKTFTAGEKVNALIKSVETDIPVSDFLLEAIISDKDCEPKLVALLDYGNEELIMYAVNLLSDMGATSQLKKYIIMALTRSVCDDVLEILQEKLMENADIVRNALLEAYPKMNEFSKAYFSAVLAECKIKDDRILPILLDEFLIHPDNIPEYANMIAKYGDERALDTLYREIEREDIKYNDFVEMRFAIESLGGEYNRARDFTNDPVYKKVREQAKKDAEQTEKMFAPQDYIKKQLKK